MEFHPRIKSLNQVLLYQKIILGSFPTWALTNPDPEKNETVVEKELLKTKNNDKDFFYGSSSNNFWSWYKDFISPSLNIEDIETIKENLELNRIGITDVIYSCRRKGKSALDKHLTKRIYNHSFFKVPDSNESLKILCTSKGVMNEMLLNKQFFKTRPYLVVNQTLSLEKQHSLLKKIDGDLKDIRNPFFVHIDCEKGGTLECLALPSPGSPFRKLEQFGKSSQAGKDYLNSYLELAFNWFKT